MQSEAIIIAAPLISPAWLLFIYCALVMLASLAGGWLLLFIHLTKKEAKKKAMAYEIEVNEAKAKSVAKKLAKEAEAEAKEAAAEEVAETVTEEATSEQPVAEEAPESPAMEAEAAPEEPKQE